MPIAGKIFWYRNPEVQQRLQVFSVQPHHQNGIGKIKRVHKDIRVDKKISASRSSKKKESDKYTLHISTLPEITRIKEPTLIK